MKKIIIWLCIGFFLTSVAGCSLGKTVILGPDRDKVKSGETRDYYDPANPSD